MHYSHNLTEKMDNPPCQVGSANNSIIGKVINNLLFCLPSTLFLIENQYQWLPDKMKKIIIYILHKLCGEPTQT